MANLIYTKFLELVAKNDLDWETVVLRAMLERSTSTYSPDKDHDDRGDLTGFVEISVGSYARRTLANAAVNLNDAADRVELDADDLAFGNLESGQTVKALVIYQQVGGDDSTPNDDILVAYIDTDSGGLLPAALAAAPFFVTVNAQGLIQFAQP